MKFNNTYFPIAQTLLYSLSAMSIWQTACSDHKDRPSLYAMYDRPSLYAMYGILYLGARPAFENVPAYFSARYIVAFDVADPCR